MNTSQIRTFLRKQLKDFNFCVLASDKLPNQFELPLGMIINLSKSNEKGTHWVTLFIDHHRNGIYFDSFGLFPRNKDILTFISENCHEIEINGMQLQQINSSVCGNYASIFLLSCFNGISLDEFCYQFSKNTFINDLYIKKLFLNLESKIKNP